FRPPWTYDLMAIGYWLAALPTAAILVGAVLAVRRFISQPRAEWFLILGFSFVMGLAMLHLSLAMPYYSVKAFYGLSALTPLCALGGWGFESLARRSGKLRAILCVGLGVWGLNSCASFWILRGSAPILARAIAQYKEGRYDAAVDALQASL